MNSTSLVSDLGSGRNGLVSIWCFGTFFVECFECGGATYHVKLPLSCYLHPQGCEMSEVMNFVQNGMIC